MELRSRAEAVRRYAKSAKRSLDLQNQAAEARLRAERKAGALLSALNLHGGNRNSRSRTTILKLESLGVSRDQSARWQREAAVPEEHFLAYLQEARSAGHEITGSGLLRTGASHVAGKRRRQDKLATPITALDSSRRATPEPDHEDLVELSNHCALLASLLQPFFDGSQAALDSTERRHAAYLMREIETCIGAMLLRSAGGPAGTSPARSAPAPP